MNKTCPKSLAVWMERSGEWTDRMGKHGGWEQRVGREGERLPLLWLPPPAAETPAQPLGIDLHRAVRMGSVTAPTRWLGEQSSRTTRWQR